MSSVFDSFIQFGNVGTTERREALAKAIIEHLQSGGEKKLELEGVGLPLFTNGVRKTLDNKDLLRLCAADDDLATRVTQEVLDQIQLAQRSVKISDNPHSEERSQWNNWVSTNRQQLQAAWAKLSPKLKDHYPQKEIDPVFYAGQFKEAFEQQPKDAKGKSRVTPESIQSHLADKWQALLTQKEIAWQLSIIEQERAKFVKDLYARIEELKKLQEALAPFTQQLGRLWDMSKGNLQRLNFDLLKQYADLLQRSEVLQQLAEMLGRMRKAETELEEETYRDVEIKTVWRVDHAQKSELVGVREGDDLNHLLPGETALLSDPELEVLFYKRFAEKRLQIYEFQGRAIDVEEEEVERQRLKSKEDKKGPIIICVDTSGSMHGTPEQVAKVLCFALLKIALNEQRKCYLINFSTGIHTMDLTEFQHSLPRLLDFLRMSFHGGTDAAPALEEALRKLKAESYRKSDILMISDFVMSNLPEGLKTAIQAAKATETKFHSLVIGSSANDGVIQDFDHNWHYDPSRPESLKKVLKELGGDVIGVGKRNMKRKTFMKHPKIIPLLLAILLIALTCMAQPADTSIAGQLQALQLQMEILQGHQGNLDARYENKSVALDNQVEGINNLATMQLVSILVTAGALLLGMIGGWVVIYRWITNRAKKRIELKVRSYTDEQIPKVVDAGLKTSIEKEFRENAAEFNELLHRYARVGHYRKQKRLLVLCDDPTRESEMVSLLNGRFKFEHVTTRIVSEYESFPDYDLIIIDHELSIRDEDHENLKNELVRKYLTKEPGRIFLYFGHFNAKLDDSSRTTAFANGRFTLYSRIIDVFDYLSASQVDPK